MPPEIADSDAESEGLIDEVEADPATPGTLLPDNKASQVSPVKVDFDEFIEPTQRLSDLPASQGPSFGRSTGSTEKLLRGLDKARKHLVSSFLDGNMNHGTAHGLGTLDGTSPSLSRKRGQPAIDPGSGSSEQESSKKKRAKTYSTKSKNANTQSTDLFPDISFSNEHETTQRTNGGSAHEASSTSMGPPEPQSVPRGRDRPRRVISLLEESMTDPNHHFSTSTSSMGGYQSINLDFRGSGTGLDINANPFGGLSQVSVDGEAALGDMTQTPHLYGNVEQADTVDPAALQNETIEQEMMTSPTRALDSEVLQLEAAAPSGLTQNNLQETPDSMARPSKRRKTDMDNKTRSTASPAPGSVRRAASVSAESISVLSNARGKKSKTSKFAASSPAPDAAAVDPSEPADDHHAMDPPPSRTKRSRKGTVESSSQASQDSGPVSNTKRKRKKTATEEMQDRNSPDKEPTSGLHLSNEDMIGLPKEQYKPRPSRSRSKRSVDEGPEDDAPPGETHLDEVAPEPVVEIETPKPGKGKGKAKKSKVKRAKTSGVALKKSEPMLSEGEDDILFMDEQPAAVKLDLPPDVGILKQEDKKPSIEDEDDEDGIKMTGRAAKQISIEIPPPEEPDNQPPAPEPKKRGRKPKKRTPSAPTPEPLTDPEDEITEANTNANSRAALAEKDSNISSLPKATTAEGKENLNPSPSPAKPASATHSPLKATTTVKSISRYRVGLSKRQSIPSLLRRVDKTKKAPTKVSTTVKERKVKATDDGSGDEGDGMAKLGLRDKNGQLIEWEF